MAFRNALLITLYSLLSSINRSINSISISSWFTTAFSTQYLGHENRRHGNALGITMVTARKPRNQLVWQESTYKTQVGGRIMMTVSSDADTTITTTATTSTTTSTVTTNELPVDPLEQALQQLFSISDAQNVLQSLTKAGLISPDENYQRTPESSKTILNLCKSLAPVEIHQMLHQDFQLPILHAHQVRAAILHIRTQPSSPIESTQQHHDAVVSFKVAKTTSHSLGGMPTSQDKTETPDTTTVTSIPNPKKAKNNYKKVVVNQKAKLRKEKETYDYGLPKNYDKIYPQLAQEMDDFLDFMTQPNAYAQEDPIRHATASVYVRHAKLFLGWYRQDRASEPAKLSIYTILPDSSRDSIQPLLDFLRYLQQDRSVSANYQANVLRGLVKLAKFRFQKESQAVALNQLPFADVPMIQELRKYHRNAHKQQQKAPRSSNEHKKWLDWTEYLRVVKVMGEKAQEAMQQSSVEDSRTVATLFQKYLVLALFAHIPDRQRTIRELEIGRNLVRDDETGKWVIRHAPEDYKTGKAYGERPPMSLTPLSDSIDNFIDNWRPALKPSTNHLFCQAKTGRPLTGDSVYQIVVRSCFEHTGKRTNPHLLRDMIVTHVRQSNASEKQLEALALFMAHSLQVQRASYDRRSLSQKVEPAVELLQSVNADLQ